MIIEYLGHSCFRITGENGVTILTDPYTKVGYELRTGLTADVVTVSHEHFDHNFTQAIEGDFQILRGFGKSEIKSVEFEGISTFHDERQGCLRGKNTVFVMKIDGMTVCHFGDFGEAYNEQLIKKLGKIDVLLLPIGGTYTIDATQAMQYVKALTPAVVIPMHYKGEDCVLDISDEKEFLRLCEGLEIENVTGKTEIFTSNENAQTKIVFMKRERKI